jgi:hypothetical protein
MTTILVILIVWWVVVRIIRLIRYLWSDASAESSPRTDLAAAA